MSGFAAINGEPDGAPLLPPIALTDEVAALAGAFAVMVALRERDRSGEGQVVDVNLLESMLQMMSALPSAAAHLDYEQPRLGSGIPYSVPRGTYRCADGKWIAISTSTESVAHRVLDAARRRRRPALRDVRGARRAPRGARRDRGGVGRRAVDAPRCWPRSTRPRPRSRPCTRCATSWPIRTCSARGVFVEVDGVVHAGPGRAAARARPARCASSAGRSAPTPTRCSTSCDAIDADAGFVLVASPFTGPFAWSTRRAGATRAAADGSRCTASTTAIDPPVVLVAHSGGGPQLPALAARTRRAWSAWCSSMRCSRIPGRSWAQTVPDAFAAKLKARARSTGSCTPWPQWWGDATHARARSPTTSCAHEFVRACPRGSRRRDRRGDARRCPSRRPVFVQLSETYAPETAASRERGLARARARRAPPRGAHRSRGVDRRRIALDRSTGVRRLDRAHAGRRGRGQLASGASSTRSRPRERASSSARLAWCTSSAAPSACVG